MPAGPSILFRVADRPDDRTAEPGFFQDLNLDQVVAGITAGLPEHRLTPLFHSPLSDVDTIDYRHEIFTDLERLDIHRVVSAFTQRRLVAQFDYRNKEMREDDRGRHHYYRERLFLNAVDEYCQAVTDLESGLRAVGVRSRGLADLCDYLTATSMTTSSADYKPRE